MFRALIIVVFYVVAIPIIGLVGIPWTFITGDVTWMYNRAMWAALHGVLFAGVKLEVKGLEQLDPKKSYIFMCNHVSNLDPPLVVPSIPGRSSILVKKEVFRIPILATAMRMADMIPVDRKNRESAIQSVEKAREVMQSGVNMTIFPEGTRSPDGRLMPFKKGPFILASETGFPVVPMTIFGSETLMPKGTMKVLPGKVTIVFHAPMDPKDHPDRDVMAQIIHDKIASVLPDHMKPMN